MGHFGIAGRRETPTRASMGDWDAERARQDNPADQRGGHRRGQMFETTLARARHADAASSTRRRASALLRHFVQQLKARGHVDGDSGWTFGEIYAAAASVRARVATRHGRSAATCIRIARALAKWIAGHGRADGRRVGGVGKLMWTAGKMGFGIAPCAILSLVLANASAPRAGRG